MTFPAFAGSAKFRTAKPSLLERFALALADSRRRKAQRIINERAAHYGPQMLEAAGLKHLSLANNDLLPFN